MKRTEKYTEPDAIVRRRREREASQPARKARNHEYMRALAKETRRTATSRFKRWTPDELAIVLRTDLTLVQMAEMTGRTYQAVANKRSELLA